MASNCLSDKALNPLTTLLFAVLLSCGAADVYGRSPSANHPAKAPSAKAANQPFLREYALGVQRIPMDGGKMYGNGSSTIKSPSDVSRGKTTSLVSALSSMHGNV